MEKNDNIKIVLFPVIATCAFQPMDGNFIEFLKENVIEERETQLYDSASLLQNS